MTFQTILYPIVLVLYLCGRPHHRESLPLVRVLAPNGWRYRLLRQVRTQLESEKAICRSEVLRKEVDKPVMNGHCLLRDLRVLQNGQANTLAGKRRVQK